MPFILFAFCFILSKTKNVKNILFPSISARIRQNDQIFVKDCFVIRRIIKIFYRDVPDKMTANSKLSPQYYCVTVILLRFVNCFLPVSEFRGNQSLAQISDCFY